MKHIQEYFVAANDASLQSIDEGDQLKNYIDQANSSQMALRFTNSQEQQVGSPCIKGGGKHQGFNKKHIRLGFSKGNAGKY